MEKLTIISAGLGDLALLTHQAMDIISVHKNIYISEERFSTLKEVNPRIKMISFSKLEETIRKSEKDIAIIVSGDYGFFSLAKTFVRIFSQTKELELINGISSIQYFATKVGSVYHDWLCLSLHGSNIKSLVPYVSYNRKVFILTSGKIGFTDVCNILLGAGFSNLNISVGENLSYENERIFSGTLNEISQMNFGELTVMLIENPQFVDVSKNSSEKDFITGKVPLNSDILRSSILHKLDLHPLDVVYNFGAGSGDLSVDIAKKVSSGLVYAFEEDETSFKVMEKNKFKNGTFNVFNFNMKMPSSENGYFSGEPLFPSKVLISGESENFETIFKWVMDANSICRFVVNANSVQKLNISMECFRKFGVEPEVTLINCSNVKNTDEGNLFCAQNPTFLVVGEISLS